MGDLSMGVGGLVYGASAGNGEFGMGFGAADMGGISRRTSHGTPVYDDDADEFTFDGAVLVPAMNGIAPLTKGGYFRDVPATVGSLETSFRQAMLIDDPDDPAAAYTVRYYRPRIEAAFSQIEYWTARTAGATPGITSFWRLVDGSNSVRLFGVDPLARIADPADPGRIFQWLPQESLSAGGVSGMNAFRAEDASGVDLASPSEANRAQTAQRYLDRSFSGHRHPYPQPLSFLDSGTLAQVLAANPWYFETVSDYGEYALPPATQDPYTPVGTWTVRPDSHSAYHAGFEIRTHRLCHRVLAFNRVAAAAGANPVLTSVTQHHYLQNERVTLLKAAEQISFYLNPDSNTYEYMAGVPEEISYTGFTPDGQCYGTLSRTDGAPLMAGDGFAPMDLYGEGIPGFLYADGETRCFYRITWQSLQGGTGELQYAEQDLTGRLPAHFLGTDATHHFMDISGDGNLDYVIIAPNQSGYYEYDSRTNTWGGFVPFPAFPTEGYLPQHYFVDLTGDGRSDIVVLSGNRIRYYRNLGSQGFAPGKTLEVCGLPPSLTNTPDQVFAFASMTGDDKVHLVHVTRSRVTYWPNLGYGRFGAPVIMGNVPDFGRRFRSDRIYFADLDGDGATDLIVVGDDGDGKPRLNIYMNQSGNSLAEPFALDLPDGARFDDLDRIYFSDVLGNGTSCLVYCQTHPIVKTWYYDFSNGSKPYLVWRKNSNLGADVTVSHKSSVHYYLEDEANGQPWIVRVPFPMQLVSEVVTVDALSKNTLTSSHRYRHAYYDGIEREFRGFGYSEDRDTLDFDETPQYPVDSPPSLTKSWFHLGAEDQDSLSRLFAAEYFAGDARAAQLGDSVIVDAAGECIGPGSTDPIEQELYREAQMALKGSTLRTEVYGLDGTPCSGNPYSTSEVNATVRVLQARGGNQYAVVQVLPREQLTYNYERNPSDPLYGYSAALAFDEYGHVLQSCSLSFPRRVPAGDAHNVFYQEQRKLRLSCTLGAVLNLTDATTLDPALTGDELYLLGIPVESQACVIAPQSADGSIALAAKLGYAAGSTDALVPYATLQNVLQAVYTEGAGFRFTDSDSAALAELVAWQQTAYLYATSAPMPDTASSGDGSYAPGVNTGEAVITPFAMSRVGSRGVLLPWYEDSVAYDKPSIADAYADFFSDMNWGTPDQAMSGAHYRTKKEGGYWWVRSGHVIYQPGTEFFKPVRAYDPLDVMQVEVAYDDSRLFVTTYTDAFGNVQSVDAIDYQHMQPTRAIDINANASEVLLDAAGTVIASSYYGSETRFLKNPAKTAPDDLDPYYHECVGFGPLDAFGISLYDEYGMETQQSLGDQIAGPRAYLQNASDYFYYDKFAWMGRISRNDLSALRPDTGGDAPPDVNALWSDLTQRGYIGYTGAILTATRDLTAGELVLDPPNQPYASSLVALFATTPAGVQPVNVATLKAVQYPRIFPEDLRDVTGTDGSTIAQSDWTALWSDLVAQGHIDQDGLIAASVWNIGSAAGLALSQQNLTYQQSLYDYIQTLSQILISVGYNDGFGRSIQSKSLIEDGTDCMLYDPSAPADAQIVSNSGNQPASPRWWATGHVVYNNKGMAAKQYEPYFINSPAYIDYQVFDAAADPAVQALVTNTVTCYDPLGRTPYVITNKGFLQKSDWTAWEAATYDANDCFIDSPYFQDNVTVLNPEGAYYNDELTDVDRAVLANPALYRTRGSELSPQGLAYYRTLQHAWTPGVVVQDNRGRPLVGVAIDNRQFSAADFTGVAGDQAETLFGILQEKEYLDSVGYLGANLTMPPLVLMDTAKAVSPGNQACFAGFNRLLLNVLLARALQGQPVTPDDVQNGLVQGVGTFYALYPFLDAYGDSATIHALLESKNYLVDGMVNTGLLPIPVLDLSETSFAGSETAVLGVILQLWSTGLRELPTVNCYDNQGRATSITDARFVWNNYEAYAALLFAQ